MKLTSITNFKKNLEKHYFNINLIQFCIAGFPAFSSFILFDCLILG